MNKNRKIKRRLTTSLAVGMSVMMGAVPVFAADSTDTSKISKEESVYVNADATGSIDQITVSDWLKNSGNTSGSLADKSDLKDIKNVKGDEKFTENGDSLTWAADGKDIYYQGTTDKDLPVSVKFTYYLDGKEVKPEDIKGKSGHLKIQIQYTNTAKKTVQVDGKNEEVYTPFMMMTGMILPSENFSNVVIDNGKVISDGDRSIVVGFGMPGLKESLDLDSDMEEKLTIPESISVEADVKDFKMSATYTAALSDMFDDMNLDDVVDVDSLQDSLDDLEDAALELVSGSRTLSDGAATLSDGVNSYTEGADELNAGIQKYLGKNGELNGSVTEYVNGVNKVVKGVQDYTDGTNALADGVNAYVKGEQQLSAGAAQLSQLGSGLQTVQAAIEKINASVDGQGENDIKAGAEQLAQGTKQLEAALGDKGVQALLSQVNGMVTTGNELITQTGALSSSLQSGIAAPVQNIAATLGDMQNQLNAINQGLAGLKSSCEATVNDANTKIKDYNNKVNAAKTAAANSKTEIGASISNLQTQLNNTTDENTIAQLKNAIAALQKAQNAAGNLENVQEASEISVTFPSIDTSAIQKDAASLTENVDTFKKTAEALNAQLPDMLKKLNAISEAKDKLPTDQLKKLSTSVQTLNAGMQALNTGIGTLSSGVGELNTKVQAQFPTAMKGISALNSGFAQLNANNKALLSGANQLKANSSTLVAGVGTLQSGTNQLAGGLNTLGSQMSSGSAKLAANSNLLRAGASDLKDGAKELADGMDKFDKEGTSKLKSTVEDELGDVVDRIKAITSEDCAYNTFTGKDNSMDGSVKFIIETDEVE